MKTREHIMEVSMKLFAEKGFEATTVRDIAAAAQVNLALINYHFESKEGLLRELIEQRALLMQMSIKEIVSDRSLEEPQKLRRIIAHYVNKLFSHHLFHRVMYQEVFLKGRGDLQASTVEIFAENARLFATVIREGIRKGHFLQVDAELCFSTLIGTIHQLLLPVSMRKAVFGKGKQRDPIHDENFRNRVTEHLYQTMAQTLHSKTISTPYHVKENQY